MRKGPKPGEVFSLATPTAILGRDPMCEITINDAEVSRNHAKLIHSEAGYLVQDMGSTNGTFIDGKRLRGEPVLLTPGQTIIIGTNVLLVYEATVNTGDPLATLVSAGDQTLNVGRPAPFPNPEATVLGDDFADVMGDEPEIRSAYIPAPAAAVEDIPARPAPAYTPPPSPRPAYTPPPEPLHTPPPSAGSGSSNQMYWIIGILAVVLLPVLFPLVWWVFSPNRKVIDWGG
ncbi:MAG: FHA domain-containing protein [Chloroflexi bacterium]|nr:FHA domain-containing protein [Chloroflexota bacterium]